MKFEKHLDSLLAENIKTWDEIIYKISFSFDSHNIDENNRMYNKFAYVAIDRGLINDILVCKIAPFTKVDIGIIDTWYSTSTRIRAVKINNLDKELEFLESLKYRYNKEYDFWESVGCSYGDKIDKFIKHNLHQDLSNMIENIDDNPKFLK